MKRNLNGTQRILILGASGFLGNALYRELLSYFDVYGTYYSSGARYDENQVFFQYSLEDDNLEDLLMKITPTAVISSLEGDYSRQLKAHRQLCTYAQDTGCQAVFLSSVSVFDGIHDFPSHEYDRPLAESNFGKHKIRIERLLLEQIPDQTTIIRLPFVLGVNSVLITQLRQAIKHHAAFEVFPNQVVKATTVDKIVQQVHYLIRNRKTGIFHSGSQDVIHHEDLFREIASKLGDKMPIFKSVFTRNEDSYLAALPRENPWPETYSISIAETIEESTLNEEIITLKN